MDLYPVARIPLVLLTVPNPPYYSGSITPYDHSGTNSSCYLCYTYG